MFDGIQLVIAYSTCFIWLGEALKKVAYRFISPEDAYTGMAQLAGSALILLFYRTEGYTVALLY